MHVSECKDKVTVYKSRCEMVCEDMDEFCGESAQFQMSH